MGKELNNQELDWNDEVENKPAARVPEGEHDFMIDHFERTKVGGDGKYAGQNMATVYCNIMDVDGEPQLRTNLILNKNLSWKLAQFFISIGLMEDKEGATLRMNWNQVAGRRGRCKVEEKPNYNDASKTHPEITEFLKPAAGKKWGGF